MKKKNLFIRFLLNWEEIICVIAVAAMTVLCVATIIARYVFRYGISWSTDVCDIMLIYTTFVGGAAAYKRNQHFGMDFLTDRLAPKPRYVLKLIINIVLAVMFIFLFILSVKYMIESKKLMTASRIPYRIADFAAVLGFGSMAAYSVRFTIMGFSSHKEYYQKFVLSQSQQLAEELKSDQNTNENREAEKI